MSEFRVRWEIDLDAENPLHAALLAREWQHDPASAATVFVVDRPPTDAVPALSVLIDLADLGNTDDILSQTDGEVTSRLYHQDGWFMVKTSAHADAPIFTQHRHFSMARYAYEGRLARYHKVDA